MAPNVHLHLLIIVGFIVPTTIANVSLLSPTHDVPPQIVNIDFNVVTDDYGAVLLNLRGVLADNPTRRNLNGVPVLARQRGEYNIPARWVHVNFVGRDAAVDKTTIAIRDDNIYIVGFTNSTGNWFGFKGYEHLIPGSTPLTFPGSYGGLVGGHARLKNIKLGKESTLQAVRMLALHRPDHGGPDYSTLREALAKLCVMVAEAERLRPINVTLVQGWKGTPQITALQAKYVVQWGRMSYALLMWQKTSVWTDEENKLRDVGINGPDEALRTVDLLLWPKRFTFSFDADDDAKPLADDSSTTCPCN